MTPGRHHTGDLWNDKCFLCEKPAMRYILAKSFEDDVPKIVPVRALCEDHIERYLVPLRSYKTEWQEITKEFLTYLVHYE